MRKSCGRGIDLARLRLDLCEGDFRRRFVYRIIPIISHRLSSCDDRLLFFAKAA